MTLDLFTRAESAAAFVLSQSALRPQIGLVLGSGLGAFALLMLHAATAANSEARATTEATPVSCKIATPPKGLRKYPRAEAYVNGERAFRLYVCSGGPASSSFVPSSE